MTKSPHELRNRIFVEIYGMPIAFQSGNLCGQPHSKHCFNQAPDSYNFSLRKIESVVCISVYQAKQRMEKIKNKLCVVMRCQERKRCNVRPWLLCSSILSDASDWRGPDLPFHTCIFTSSEIKYLGAASISAKRLNWLRHPSLHQE
jgi:hypothetical protein